MEISFYFDFLSPYSYLAFKELERCHFFKNLPSGEGIKFVFRPIAMPLVIKKWVDKGPAEIPPKRDFLFKVAIHRAKKLGVLFQCPNVLPFDSFPLLKLAASTEAEPFVTQVKVIGALFDEVWGNGHLPGLDELENLAQTSGQAVFESFTTRQSSKILKANLEQAQRDQIFGVPTFVAQCFSGLNGELFFGQDSIPILSDWLSNQANAYYDQAHFQQFLHACTLRPVLEEGRPN